MEIFVRFIQPWLPDIVVRWILRAYIGQFAVKKLRRLDHPFKGYSLFVGSSNLFYCLMCDIFLKIRLIILYHRIRVILVRITLNDWSKSPSNLLNPKRTTVCETNPGGRAENNQAHRRS